MKVNVVLVISGNFYGFAEELCWRLADNFVHRSCHVVIELNIFADVNLNNLEL